VNTLTRKGGLLRFPAKVRNRELRLLFIYGKTPNLLLKVKYSQLRRIAKLVLWEVIRSVYEFLGAMKYLVAQHGVNGPRVLAKTVVDEMVEAGGVEPPSEKRCDTKPTCLAQFHFFRPPRSE
jgi:hypothetical protein